MKSRLKWTFLNFDVIEVQQFGLARETKVRCQHFSTTTLKKRRQTIPILDLGPKSQLISDPGSRTLFEESVEAALIHSHTTSGCISVRVNVLFS